MAINLSSFDVEISQLISAVNIHESRNSINKQNESFSGMFTIKSTPVLLELLHSISTRIRKVEIIYHSYFKDLNIKIINGQVAQLPFIGEYEFQHNTDFFTKSMDIRSYVLYKELIDSQFQTFILTIASIHENIVRLVEMLVKKVIIHETSKKPLSFPLNVYLNYLKSLLALEYKTVNPYIECINRFNHYFDKYLETINKLRNAYAHGFESKLKANRDSYIIMYFAAPLHIASPELDVIEFTYDVQFNISGFFRDLLLTLTHQVGINSHIPI